MYAEVKQSTRTITTAAPALHAQNNRETPTPLSPSIISLAHKQALHSEKHAKTLAAAARICHQCNTAAAQHPSSTNAMARNVQVATTLLHALTRCAGHPQQQHESSTHTSHQPHASTAAARVPINRLPHSPTNTSNTCQEPPPPPTQTAPKPRVSPKARRASVSHSQHPPCRRHSWAPRQLRQQTQPSFKLPAMHTPDPDALHSCSSLPRHLNTDLLQLVTTQGLHRPCSAAARHAVLQPGTTEGQAWGRCRLGARQGDHLAAPRAAVPAAPEGGLGSAAAASGTAAGACSGRARGLLHNTIHILSSCELM